MKVLSTITMGAGVLLGFVLPSLAIDPADKCEADKNVIAGKYAFCRQKAEAKAIKRGEAADYSKCDSKLLDKWAKAEQKAIDKGTMCNDAAGGTARVSGTAIQTFVTAHTDAVAAALDGGTLSICGDGVVDPDEECDFGNLAGETCSSKLGVEALGVLACTPGVCTYDTTGCEPRYEEQNVGGEPTVLDHATGLEWVVTNDSGAGLLYRGFAYNWSTGTNDADGKAFTIWIASLNAGAYGGHMDWRLPSSGGCCGIGPFESAELESIVDCSFGSPCIDEALFGPTASGYYWSSSTLAASPATAWTVDFTNGSVASNIKTFNFHVRAVRGGV